MPIVATLILLAGCGQPSDTDEAVDAASGGGGDLASVSGLTVSDENCQVLTRWPQGDDASAMADPLANEIAIDANERPSWNGNLLSPDVLDQYLEMTATMSPVPPVRLVLQPTGSCDEAIAIAERIEAHIDCEAGACTAILVGNASEAP